jgi:hypothetical protein
MPCVRAKVEVKKTFDDSLTDAVVDQMKEAIKKQVNTKKSKGLEYKENCSDGWVLTVIVELALDGDELEIKLNTTGLSLKGKDTFQATKKRTVKGIDTDNIEKEVVKHAEATMTAAMGDVLSAML